MTIAERTSRHPDQASPPAPALVIRRIAAFALDYLLILSYLGVLVLASFLVPQMNPWFRRLSTAHWASFFLVTLPVSLYFMLSEASSAQATFGKRWMGIRVQSWTGQRLTLPASLIRTALKFAPWEFGHAAVWRFALGAGNAAQLHIANDFLATTWVLAALYLVCMAVDSRRRAPYDFASLSQVVLVPHTGSPLS